jgi:pyruvate dehydrogenase E1 component alpha subunit
MQLTGEQLVKAYRSTRTIRVFEERVHKLFATGQILGFVHQSLSRHASRSQPFNR